MTDTMSIDAAGFKNALDDMANQINGDITKVIRKACIDLYRRIVERTPVDTGRAKANWQLGTFYSANDGKEGGTFNDIASIVNSEVSGFKLGINDDQVIIYNNLEYISALENGHSAQAPSGMVAVSLAEFEQFFKDALSGANL